jgi:hypothetical protein
VPAPEPVPEPTPIPAPLPAVTLTLEPSLATVTVEDAGTILCLVAPADPYLGMPPGAVHRMCMPTRMWLQWTGAR